MKRRGGGLGSRPKKMYGKRLGDGVESKESLVRILSQEESQLPQKDPQTSPKDLVVSFIGLFCKRDL